MATRVVLMLLLFLGCSSETTGKHVFITSLTFSGNLGGLAGADQKCTTAARAGNLGGNWTAWLSDSTTNAIDRIEDVGPWSLLDGRVAFNNKTNLMTLPIVPIDVDENGAKAGMYIWTGTNIGGTRGADTCGDWSSTSGTGISGQVYSGDPQFWSGAGTHPCNDPAHLYCFEQ